MKYVAVFMALVLGSPTYARATDLYTIGNGQDTCGAWLNLRQNGTVHQGQVIWVLGFLTGSNYRTEGQGAPAIPRLSRHSLISIVTTILRINSSWPQRHSCKRAADLQRCISTRSELRR